MQKPEAPQAIAGRPLIEGISLWAPDLAEGTGLVEGRTGEEPRSPALHPLLARSGFETSARSYLDPGLGHWGFRCFRPWPQ